MPCVYHELRVQLDVGPTGVPDEMLTLYGTMLVQRDDPRVNEEGLRQIDFRVLSWKAVGWRGTNTWSCRRTVTAG